MSISKNVFGNLAIKMWTMISTFIFIPVYLNILNSESYGLITFFTTLQTALNILGLGLSKTLRRKFALPEKKESIVKEKYKLLRSVEAVYLVIFLLIVSFTFLMSSYFATEWLKFNTLPIQMVSDSIKLMGISIGLQLLANLYIGCLQGQERQVEANSYMFIWSLLKNVGVIFIIKYIKTDIFAFYLWYMLIDMLYYMALRIIVIVRLRKKVECNWSYHDLKILKTIANFAGGLLIISIGYVINTQIDKTIISSSFSLTELGAYNSCFTIGMLTCTITSAVGVALFSRFSMLYFNGKTKHLNNLFYTSNKLLTLFIVTFGAYVAVFSSEIMTIWLGDENIVSIVYNTAPLIILGSMFLSLQELPYNYLLARGITKYNVIMTLITIIFVLLISPILIYKFGLLGGGIAWLIENVVTTVGYYLFFVKKFFNDYNNLIKSDIFLPFFIAILIASFIKYILFRFDFSILSTVIVAIGSGFITLVLMFFYFYWKKMKVYLKKEAV